MEKSERTLLTRPDSAFRIIEQAKALGASLAGLTTLAQLRHSPSYQTWKMAPWRATVQAILVLALVHPEAEPVLDWWDRKQRGSPGDSRLIGIGKDVANWMREEFNTDAHPLPYHVKEGGLFLKDAAVLAGLGTIGANNLLITPEFGPRVRLRALRLDGETVPTGPIDFSPCDPCDRRCWKDCPQKAFIRGFYDRHRCGRQMALDETAARIPEKMVEDERPRVNIKYCRACELPCPVGKQPV
jgi:epoxyqueuosine reductase